MPKTTSTLIGPQYPPATYRNATALSTTYIQMDGLKPRTLQDLLADLVEDEALIEIEATAVISST